MSLQTQIPDEVSLRAKVKSIINNSLPIIISETVDCRAKLTHYRKLTLIFVAIFVCIIFLTLNQDFISLEYVVVPMIIVLIIIHYYGRLWFKSQVTLTIKLNSILTRLLTDVFGQTFTWQSSVLHETETTKLFKESGLMVESIDSLEVDDLYACQEPFPISFRELDATKLEGSGKNSSTITVFKGLFIILQLPKILQAETFISTEGDSSGFAHSSFWNRIIGNSNIEETKMEWNDFENDLHVASSDGTEARYILTTDFMEKLYNWWKEGKENIRIKFSDNRMQMLLPDNRIKISFATSNTKPEKLEEYFFTMVKPLWRTLTLVEQIKL